MKARNKIGIDLDGCVGDLISPLLKYANKKYNRSIGMDDIKCFNLHECTPITEDEWMDILQEQKDTGLLRDLPVFDGAIESINRLNKDNDIVIVTDRTYYDGIEEDTKYWLKKNNISYDKIFFDGDKAAIAKKEGIKFFIEDKLETARELSDDGVKVCLIERPWNRDEILESNIYRVKDWGGVSNYLLPDKEFSKEFRER